MRSRSARAVATQHTQPLVSSRISSSADMTSSESMLISPNSFSITAMRWPCFCVRMWLSSVVLPAPRKPVRIVTGICCGNSILPFLPESFQNLLRGDGVVPEAHADRVVQRVGDRRPDGDDRVLADALGAERPAGIGRGLQEDGADRRHV